MGTTIQFQWLIFFVGQSMSQNVINDVWCARKGDCVCGGGGCCCCCCSCWCCWCCCVFYRGYGGHCWWHCRCYSKRTTQVNPAEPYPRTIFWTSYHQCVHGSLHHSCHALALRHRPRRRRRRRRHYSGLSSLHPVP